MKLVEEFRDPKAAQRYADAIRALARGRWKIMEVCGGQTHAILKYGVDQLLPDNVSLLHGPGCPVCVTPVEIIDQAVRLAARPEVILCSFGDMLRVPGTSGDLLAAKARGGDVRIVYSPLDAVELARRNPGRQVVFFAVGFETTAPATALAVVQAHSSRLSNFSALVAHVLVRPAMRAILEAPDSAVDGFLAAGHVCAVTGYAGYEEFAARFGVPIVVTGFEPLDILQGIHACLLQLEQGRAEVENQYARVVRREGNPAAQRYLAEVFRVTSRRWRGLGELPASGFALADAYAGFDAARRFGLAAEAATEPSVCLADRVLRGAMKPTECPAFARNCSPQTPLGAPMVSTEGACAAYFWYRGQGATGETLT